jgi:hypothetical protein
MPSITASARTLVEPFWQEIENFDNELEAKLISDLEKVLERCDHQMK